MFYAPCVIKKKKKQRLHNFVEHKKKHFKSVFFISVISILFT